MNGIYIPSHFSKKMIDKAKKIIEDIWKEHPESENDFILVDELENDINVKFFYPDKVIEICNGLNITPKEYLMHEMREQNKK